MLESEYRRIINYIFINLAYIKIKNDLNNYYIKFKVSQLTDIKK